MLFSVEQVSVGRDEKRAPLKTSVWKASLNNVHFKKFMVMKLYSL